MSNIFAMVTLKSSNFYTSCALQSFFKNTELADEISHDTCRLWDMVSEKKLDKDRFRKDLGNVIEAYQEVAARLGIGR
jgi:phosphoribosylaminoimidazole-succinocarboxamide synthase